MKSEYRAWELVGFAKSQIEAVMMESFLESEGIETRRPNARALSYEAGLGPGVAGEIGIRVEVPLDQHLRAIALLAEQRERMSKGESQLPNQGPSLDRQGIESAIQSHHGVPVEPPLRGSAWQRWVIGLGVCATVLGVGAGLEEAYADRMQGKGPLALGLCLGGIGMIVVGARSGRE